MTYVLLLIYLFISPALANDCLKEQIYNASKITVESAKQLPGIHKRSGFLGNNIVRVNIPKKKSETGLIEDVMEIDISRLSSMHPIPAPHRPAVKKILKN